MHVKAFNFTFVLTCICVCACISSCQSGGWQPPNLINLLLPTLLNDQIPLQYSAELIIPENEIMNSKDLLYT